MTAPTVERFELDGVPAFWVEDTGETFGALIFRVGSADETLPTAGNTHLIEHLALYPTRDVPYSYNGFVDHTRTTFWARGDADQVREHVVRVAHTLHALPFDRLDDERRVLRTELAVGPGVYSRMLSYRFGPRGYGLPYYHSFGLDNATPDELAAWSSERFTRANAVAWFAGPARPEPFALGLPAGQRFAAPRPVPIPELQYPAYVAEGTGGVAITALMPRSTTLALAVDALQRRAYDQLRRDDGASYAVEASRSPLTPDECVVFIAADCLDVKAGAVLSGLLRMIEELAADGVTEQERQDYLEAVLRHYANADKAGEADRMANTELLGEHDYPRDRVLAEIRELDLAATRDVMRGVASSAIVLGCDDTPAPRERLVPISHERDPVSGEQFAPRRKPRGRATAPGPLIVGDTGVTASGGPTVLFGDLVAVLKRWLDTIALVGHDGTYLFIDPRQFKDGERAVAKILDAVAPDLVAEASDAGESRDVTALVAEHEEFPDVMARRIIEACDPGEEVVAVVPAASYRDVKGALVVTSRRVMFVFEHSDASYHFATTHSALRPLTHVKSRWLADKRADRLWIADADTNRQHRYKLRREHAEQILAALERLRPAVPEAADGDLF